MAKVNQYVLQQIKSLLDYTRVLQLLGFAQVKQRGATEIRACCAVHQGDNPTAFVLNPETGHWCCFSRKCHEDFPVNDIISLVMHRLNIGFLDAVRYLGGLVGIDIDTFQVDEHTYQQYREHTQYKASISEHHKKKVIRGIDNLPELDYNLYQSAEKKRSDYFRKEFSEDILDTFHVGSMYDADGVPRATIPIFDDKGRFVSMSCRREDGDTDPRYLIIQHTEKGEILYNLHNVLQLENYSTRPLILVEGFKALWHIYQCTHKMNIVALMGSTLSDSQVALIAKYGFLDLKVMLDGDAAGQDAMRRVQEKQQLRGFNAQFIKLPEGKQPNDMACSFLEKVLV